MSGFQDNQGYTEKLYLERKKKKIKQKFPKQALYGSQPPEHSSYNLLLHALCAQGRGGRVLPADSSMSFSVQWIAPFRRHSWTDCLHNCKGSLKSVAGSPDLHHSRRWYIYELRPGGKMVSGPTLRRGECWLSLAPTAAGFLFRHVISPAHAPTTVMSSTWPERGLTLDLQALKQWAK